MKKLLTIIIPVTILAVMALSARTLKDERRARADYYYMEALRRNSLQETDAYYMILERAHNLNPEDVAVGSDLGMINVLISKDSARLREGLELVRRNVDAYPADIYSSMAYFNLLVNRGETEEALRVVARLDSLNPDNVEVGFRHAETLAATGDSLRMNQALAIFSRIEKTLGKSIPLSVPVIRIHLHRKDTVAALNTLRELVEANPGSVEVLTLAGDFNAMLLKNDSALKYYDKAVQADSSSGIAYYKRAVFYQNIGDTAAYEREIVEAIDKDNLEPEVRLELLRTLVTDMIQDPDRYPEIEELFNNCVKLMPHNSDLHQMYSAFFAQIKDYTHAAEQMEYALDIDHQNEQAWLSLSVLYTNAKEYDKAAKVIGNGLRYFPDSYDLYAIASGNMLTAGNLEKARLYADSALSIASRTDDERKLASAEQMLGDILQKKGDTDSAFIHYERALELQPDNIMVMNNYAYYISLTDRDLDKAEAMSMRAVSEAPENPTYLDTYAWVMFKKGKYQQALETIRKTLELMEADGDEPSAEVFEHAGDIFFFNRMPDDAVTYWKKALELNPDSDILKKKVRERTYYYGE